MTHPLIEAEELKVRLGAPDVKLVDATWSLADKAVAGRAAFASARIPRAVFFDIDAIADAASPLPHMLPTPEDFAEKTGALGISADDEVIVYDQAGMVSSPRVWWTFRAFGHPRVRVLNGGWPAWTAAGGAIETGPPQPPTPCRYAVPQRDDSRLASLADVTAIVRGAQRGVIIDARPEARFRGEAPEPRPGLRSGAMPGALTLPAPELIGADHRLLDREALAQRFRAAGLAESGAGGTVTTCGSGVAAAILALALETLGRTAAAVYDGSWAEWGAEDPCGERPVVRTQ